MHTDVMNKSGLRMCLGTTPGKDPPVQWRAYACETPMHIYQRVHFGHVFKPALGSFNQFML